MKPLRILAVDISHLFRKNWEIDKEKVDADPFGRVVANVVSIRENYDRVVICLDGGRSFRCAIDPEYKANRKDPGEAYRVQLQRTVERLRKDGCVVLAAPQYGADSGPVYAEADDVIGSLFMAYTRHVTGLAEDAQVGWHMTILSDDGDFEQLIDDEWLDVQKSRVLGGELYTEAKVLEKRGVPPSKIVDMKALGGDGSDNYKPFRGPPKPEGGHYSGIGDATAVTLIKEFGSALGVFDDIDRVDAEGNPVIKPNVRKLLDTHGRSAALRGIDLARIRTDLPIDFAAILAEPVVEKIAEPRRPTAVAAPKTQEPPVVEGEPVADEMAKPTARTGIVLRADFDPLALQPNDVPTLDMMALMAFNSRCYAQFGNYEQVMMCIAEARERGISMGVALRNAYVVKNKLCWSTQLMIGLVLKSPLCERFEITETEMTHATVIYKRRGCEENAYTFRIEESIKAGWHKSGAGGDGKWITNPRTMLRWAAMRECARFVWPDIISGMVSPDEMRNGQITDAEFEELT